MKNKKIIPIIIGIFVLGISIVTYLLNSSKEYIIYDGVKLAITIDGDSYDRLPSSGKYNVTIECENENVIGQYEPVNILADDYTVTSNYEMQLTFENVPTSGTACNVEFTTINEDNLNDYLLTKEVESLTTNNDGYRYVGKDPDNWIWFNNEMWRIIGSIPVCTSSDDPTTSGTCAQADADRPRLVKIIRADSIGGLAFHSESGSNVWGNGNTLYTLLNSTYWGKGKVIGASPCLGYQGALATCNYNKIGISPDDYYGSMVEEVFMNVGAVAGTSVTAIAAYASEIATVTKATHVGLMNASDYGYAADLVAANKTYSGVNLSSLSSYEQYNWLFGTGFFEWTMTPYSSYFLSVNYAGHVFHKNAFNGYAVRPVVYLDSSVYIISGDGSATNPYIIGM